MTEQADGARARAGVYRFLSAAFLETPGKALVATLSRSDFIGELEEVFGAAAVTDLRRFVAGFQGDYESLDQQFQDLFMVPLGRYVTPYEAVYRDQRMVGDTVVGGLLMGPSTLAIKQFYREAGAAVSEDFKDLPDHVGLELACMTFLCEEEARALEGQGAGDARRVQDLQKRLLHEHLLQWVPALCGQIRAKAPGPFYRGIAGLTEAYLRREAEALASQISPGKAEGL